MNSRIILPAAVLAIGLLCIAGCDIGTNPLVFDGSVTSGSIRVDLIGPLGGTYTTPQFEVDLNALFESSKLSGKTYTVDSAHFYNMTLMIDSNSTPLATVTGSLNVNGNAVVNLDSVAVSAFTTERSIFDTTIVGMHFNAGGVTYLIDALKQNPPPTIDVSATFGPIPAALHFTLHVKVYGQIYTSS